MQLSPSRLSQLIAHSGFRRYAANTSWLLLENILRLGAGILVGVWVTRYLGPEKYGVLSYVLAFAAIFAALAKMGLDGIVVRNLVNHPEGTREYLGTAFWLKFAGALLTLVVVTLASIYVGSSRLVSFYILVITAGLLFQSFEVIDFYFQSLVQSKFVSICKIAQLSISLILKIYFMYMHADIGFFVALYLIDQVTLALALYLAYRHKNQQHFLDKFNPKLAKSLLGQSWPLIIISLAIMVQGKIDQLIISDKMGSLQLGYYATAIGLVEILSFIPMIINSSLAPAIINAKKRSQMLYLNRLQAYYSFSFLLFLGVGIPLALFARQLIAFLYGPQFAPASVLLPLMVFRLFFANMGVARSLYILNENLFTFNLLTTLLGALVSIVMNLLLIPRLGAGGAILASYASFFVSTFAFELFQEKARVNLIVMLKGILFSYKLVAVRAI